MNSIVSPQASELDLIIKIKKYAYLLVTMPSVVLLMSAWLGQKYGYMDIFAFTTVCFVFILVPILDHIIGQDPGRFFISLWSKFIRFLPHAYLHNFLNAWSLEAKKLKRKGKSLFSVSNELIWWYGISLIFSSICGFLWGWAGVGYFFAQSFVAFFF
jgi:hypothetical protein